MRRIWFLRVFRGTELYVCSTGGATVGSTSEISYTYMPPVDCSVMSPSSVTVPTFVWLSSVVWLKYPDSGVTLVTLMPLSAVLELDLQRTVSLQPFTAFFIVTIVVALLRVRQSFLSSSLMPSATGVVNSKPLVKNSSAPLAVNGESVNVEALHQRLLVESYVQFSVSAFKFAASDSLTPSSLKFHVCALALIPMSDRRHSIE